MSNLLNQKLNEILNKKFKKALQGGYDAYDVDAFFDEVIAYLKQTCDLQTNHLLAKELENTKKQLLQVLDKNKLLQAEVDFYKKEGYSNERLSQTIKTLEKRLESLEKDKK